MAVFTGNDHKGKSQKERIQEITAQLEADVLAVFESDVYRAYLKCMSKLYSFSGDTFTGRVSKLIYRQG